MSEPTKCWWPECENDGTEEIQFTEPKVMTILVCPKHNRHIALHGFTEVEP